ncbi:MAG: hypothetical protein HC767_07815 [Akkermansiaceae bacterium]|nr:hypothetical protein [Akkermansiaceae bacterium]
MIFLLLHDQWAKILRLLLSESNGENQTKDTEQRERFHDGRRIEEGARFSLHGLERNAPATIKNHLATPANDCTDPA